MGKIRILATTDVHGSVSTRSYADHFDQGCGLTRFASAVKQFREQGETFVVDNGDILQGTPFLTIANKQQEEPHVLSRIMNKIGYDFVNLGNHDFNFGYPVLERYLHDLNAPCLTSNITYKDHPFGISRLITTSDQQTIALIGVCTDYIPHWEKPVHIQAMEFNDPIETVKKEVSRYKPLADVVIVMYHGGLERDPFNGTPTERFTGENVGYQIAQLEGIDVLITGHQHRSFLSRIANTQVVQTTFNALEFAEITIDFAARTQIDVAIRKMRDFDIDIEIEAIAKTTEAATQRWLDEALGHITGPSLKIIDPFEARLHKHPLVSFINQVQIEVSGAQLSACALFNGVKGFNSDITYRDIVSTYIYPNTLVVKRMNKACLKEFLEKCAEYFSIKDDKIIVTPSFDDPKPQHFNYDMVDGIDYTIKVSNPIGQRIIKMEYQGKEIAADASFTIVLNNYRAVGGGDFMMVPACETVSEVNRDMSELLAEAIQSRENYLVNHRDNIQVIQ